jgi:hypothetical protein
MIGNGVWLWQRTPSTALRAVPLPTLRVVRIDHPLGKRNGNML